MLENLFNELLTYINDGDLQHAREMIEKYEDELSDHDMFLKLKALFHIKKKEYAEAIRCLSEARQLVPNDREVDYLLTNAYEGKEEEEIIKYDFPLAEALFHSRAESLARRRTEITKLLCMNDTPLVSIYILAYNHLEDATKTCIECVLRYTQDIEYELILVDNASTDDTLKYFEQIPYPKKKIIHIEENKGSMYGCQVGMREVRGRYMVSLPNDIWVTKNWLKNMLICMESDESIGMVVPMSDNTSNHQDPRIKYADFADMQAKAALFNVSDPEKWQERLRLITVAALCRRECLETMGFFDYGFFHNFADDDLSFRYRQYGYKLILCGDVFVHHMGSTVGGEDHNRSIRQGLNDFQQKFFGLNAWKDTYLPQELEMMNFDINLERNKNEEVKILGIEVRCGSILFQLKSKLKQQQISKIKISAFSTEAKYWVDLHSACDDMVHVDKIEAFSRQLYPAPFDFILIGEPLNCYSSMSDILSQALSMLKLGGHLRFRINRTDNVRSLLCDDDLEEEEQILRDISIRSIIDVVKKHELFSCHVTVASEKNRCDGVVEHALETIGLHEYTDVILENMQALFYIFDVYRIK